VARLVFCYAVGLLLFVGWPVAGPYLVFPASISSTFAGLNTRAIMQSSLVEFAAIRLGGQPVTGFGYFVGLPSLHVAMAVLLQFTIQQRSRIGAWVVAPINMLMIASTFVLGYHYLADVPGGVLLAFAAIKLVRERASSGPLVSRRSTA
jgi:membrane-associated phospholipid phosphatase